MTSAVRNHASLTTNDVNRLIDRMAEVVSNDSSTRQSAAKHGTATFPRGTDVQRNIRIYCRKTRPNCGQQHVAVELSTAEV